MGRIKSPRTAVVLAGNARNSGMYSVDLAAKHFFRKTQTTFFCAHVFKGKLADLVDRGISVTELNSERQFDDFDNIVFWGDFLNNPMYGRGGYARRDLRTGRAASLEDAQRNWVRLIMLAEFEKGARRIFSVGNNFMSCSSGFDEDFGRQEFMESLKKFDMIFPRDSMSYTEISKFCDAPKVLQGMDCAHFLSLTAQRDKPPRKPYFVYLLQRSDIDNTQKVIKSIEHRLGMTGISMLDWLALKGVSRSHPMRLKRVIFQKMIRMISEAQFALTDVYHFSINSVNQRTPVFLVGVNENQESEVSDFKKKILFEDLGLSNYHISLDTRSGEELEGKIMKKIDDLHALFDDYKARLGSIDIKIRRYHDLLSTHLFADSGR